MEKEKIFSFFRFYLNIASAANLNSSKKILNSYYPDEFCKQILATVKPERNFFPKFDKNVDIY